jgi:DNA-binding GntR family transcriptional regulator
MVLSHFTGLLHDIKHVDLGQLHHREVLQAGIQQLNGEFYGAMLKAAGKQHAEEMRRSNRQHAQGVIPASWMRA